MIAVIVFLLGFFFQYLLQYFVVSQILRVQNYWHPSRERATAIIYLEQFFFFNPNLILKKPQVDKLLLFPLAKVIYKSTPFLKTVVFNPSRTSGTQKAKKKGGSLLLKPVFCNKIYVHMFKLMCSSSCRHGRTVLINSLFCVFY